MTGHSLARDDREFVVWESPPVPQAAFSKTMSFRTSPLKWCGNLHRHCDRIPPKDGNTPVSALFLTLYHPHLKKASRKVELRLVQGAGRFVQKDLKFLQNSI